VYVGGHTWSNLGGPLAGWYDAWVARYDGTGNQLWIRQHGSSERDYLYAAAPDRSGGVFVGGSTDGDLAGPNAGSSDAWLARIDGAGNLLWIRQIGSSSADGLAGAAPDGIGGVYVAGSVFGSLGGPHLGMSDVWLARYDHAGNRLWIRQFGTAGDDQATCAVSSGSGGVVLGGTTRASLGGPNAGGHDAWLACYDGAGNQLWLRQLGTTQDDRLLAASMDGSSGVFIAGETLGSLGGQNPKEGTPDGWLARYVPDCSSCTSFCTAKSGLACGPAGISAVGNSSASVASGFLVRALPARSCKSGILLYNTSRASVGVPFEGGTLCVSTQGIRRAGATDSMGTPGGANCDGVFQIDMNAFAGGAWVVPDCVGGPSGLASNNAAAFLSVPGQSVYTQFWGRDALVTGSYVSDGLAYVVAP
jgi:hypothetical protein